MDEVRLPAIKGRSIAADPAPERQLEVTAAGLPIAILLAASSRMTVFWLLWHLVGRPIDVHGLKEASRIDFSRMRRDTKSRRNATRRFARAAASGARDAEDRSPRQGSRTTSRRSHRSSTRAAP